MEVRGVWLFVISVFAIACAATLAPTHPLRAVRGYPVTVDASASVTVCLALEPSLPKPMSDDEVLEPYVGVATTRRTRACSPDALLPHDRVGRNGDGADSQGPWDVSTARARREDLSIVQRYWTLLPRGGKLQCRFVGEVRLPLSQCGNSDKSEEIVDSSAVLPTVDLITGEPIADRPGTAVNTTNHWKQ